MSKTLRTAAIVVGVTAAVATGIGVVIGPTAAAAAGSAGVGSLSLTSAAAIASATPAVLSICSVVEPLP